MGPGALRSNLAMALAIRFPELLSEITEPLAPVLMNRNGSIFPNTFSV